MQPTAARLQSNLDMIQPHLPIGFDVPAVHLGFVIYTGMRCLEHLPGQPAVKTYIFDWKPSQL